MGYEKHKRPLLVPPYETTAQPTGERWVDDKPIYRKCLAVAAGPNAGSVNVAHGITGLDAIVSITGSLTDATDWHPVGGTSLTAAATATNVVLTSAANLSTFTGYVVVEYTLS